MRHDRITGAAAEQHPEINELGKAYAEADIHHSTTGVRRRHRRAAQRALKRARGYRDLPIKPVELDIAAAKR